MFASGSKVAVLSSDGISRFRPKKKLYGEVLVLFCTCVL